MTANPLSRREFLAGAIPTAGAAALLPMAVLDGGASTASSPGASTPGVVSALTMGVAGDGRTDDGAALRAAALTCAANGQVLYLPAGTYRVTGAIDWRIPRLSVRGAGRGMTIIQQSTANSPILLLGEEQQHVSDLDLRYARQAGTEDTRSVAILLHKASYSVVERLSLFWVHTGIALYQGPYASATDDSPNNWMFSCSWRDIEVLGWRRSAIDTTAFNAANTGSLWQNLYLRNGPLGPAETSTSYPLVLKNLDEAVLQQVNIEATNLPSSDAVLVQGSSVTINGLHFEGVSSTQWDGSLVQVYDTGTAVLTSMTVQGCVFGANRGAKSLLKVGHGANLRVTGLRWGNANSNRSSAFALLHALDGTGSAIVDAVTLGAFSTDVVGSSAVLLALNGRPYPA